jgi:hypothetical protein
MPHHSVRAPRRHTGRLMASLAALLLLPGVASAQYSAPDSTQGAVGEKYHVEFSGSFWNPTVFGVVSSEQFRQLGSDIDVVKDLGFKPTRFGDMRIVLRPSKKSRFRVQYTPIRYEATSSLQRSIVFNGQRFDVALPIQSAVEWKVWRFGYEYDFLYLPRGFVGVLLEARYTQFTAELNSAINTEFTSARAPLPALGVVGRGYVLPNLAINFEVTGFRLPEFDKRYEATYFDWDINGTFNVTNNVGVQVGWRKLTNFLRIENDLGDLRFQGLWFGAAVRY